MKAGWLALYLSNLDQPRIVSRWGDEGIFRVQSAKMLGLFLHTLRGTPFIYQGEEIGMTNWDFKKEEAKDIEFTNFYKELVDSEKMTHEKFMELAHKRGRDNARTPMQWSADEYGGFTNNINGPWISMNKNFDTINVKSSLEDKDSILNFYKQLIQIRKENSLIVYGTVNLKLIKHPSVIAWTRESDEEPGYFLLTVCNFSNVKATIKLTRELKLSEGDSFDVLLSNYNREKLCPKGRIKLKPFEAFLLKITKKKVVV
jgi:oligo-1,6-glucosidase